MFKLQIRLPGAGWMNVNEDFKSRIPSAVDVIAYCRRNYPSSDFRVILNRNEELLEGKEN